VREETGLGIALIALIALTGVYKNMARGIIALVVRAKVTGGHPATTNRECRVPAGCCS
jgi:8-oxo-dGTP diphosphatase